MDYTNEKLNIKGVLSSTPSFEARVIQCPTCEGRKVIGKEELVDYHKRDYRTSYSECPNCGGLGAMTEVIVSVRVSTEFYFGDKKHSTQSDTAETRILTKLDDPSVAGYFRKPGSSEYS